MKYVLLYFVLVSLVAIIVTVSDKIRAKRNGWRTPESTLLIISALGGSVAMYLTMLSVRHKTKHIKFMLGIPIIILFQAVVVVFLLRNFL
ncbi:MAG: DUF1294 domain-containing protein [Ruminococcaceae bacterium]|nr:DUF1294 domain-containing protein [Oscillospiraceae bacterium]